MGRLFCVGLGAALLFAGAPAHAEEDPTPDMPRREDPPPPDKPNIGEEPIHKNALLIFPIGLPLGRLSAAYLRSVVGRHVLSIGGFAQATGFLIPTSEQAMAGVGGELGYRFFSSEGMRGFFIGPSFSLGRYYYAESLQLKDILNADLSISKNSGFFTGYALSLDVGYQYLFRNGGLLGFGLGAQYNVATKTQQEMSPIAYLIAGSGFRPRVLMIVGAAF